jgi:flagellar biosynthesis GTPase FlhF
MELKRILARDTRSATERAMSLYGPDVLIIANHRVGGQTELVVAVELASAQPDANGHVFDSDNPFAKAAPVAAAPTHREPTLEAGASFGDQLGQALRGKEQMPTPSALRHDPLLNAARQDPLLVAEPVQPAEALRDQVRSQEIVAFVVEELAALRREFRVSQQTAEWQSSQTISPAMQPLVQAMHQAEVPAGLRTLLIDAVKDHDSVQEAMQAIRALLTSSLQRGGAPGAFEGVHAIAGPSGAGKTLMAARLALHTAVNSSPDQVAFISFHDARIGAWSQTQMLCAQMGVDCFRAPDVSTLSLLLAELSQRQLVLIDTPGVQMVERLKDIKKLQPQAIMHAVLPADASAVSVQRILKDAAQQAAMEWDSLMISKLDESSAPWALLQFMCNEADVPVLSAASASERLTDLVMGFTPAQLVNLAVSQLMPAVPPTLPNRAPTMASSLASSLASNMVPAKANAGGLSDATAFNARAMTFNTAPARP